MAEVFQRWDVIENPRAYARRAAISNLIKNKQRGLLRIRARLIEQGHVPAAQELDSDLSAWEEQEWVTQLLKSLPPAQREVLACMVDEFAGPEIAQQARTIGEHFREGTAVIIDLTEMADSDAKRLVDFSAGLIFGLRGSIEAAANKVFVLSPASRREAASKPVQQVALGAPDRDPQARDARYAR